MCVKTLNEFGGPPYSGERQADEGKVELGAILTTDAFVDRRRARMS
jgi:hypothetical protein